MNKTFAAVVCGTILGLGLVQASAAAAASFADSTPQLRLRLKNDFRRASKPSAGANENIYAWVQGAMLEFDTGWYNDLIAVEGGGFWVQKLDSHEGKHTRWYLNSDDESFGYVNAAVKVRLGDYGLIKAGRFVTDTGYGALPYWVPLITSNSNRTLPTSSQGVLAYLTPTDWLDVWGLWRNEVFTSTSALLDGYRYEGIYDPATGDYEGTKRPYSALALSFHDQDKWRLSLGAALQNSSFTQYEANFDGSLDLGGHQLKNTLRYFYADVNDDTWELWQHNGIYSDDTYLISGMHNLALSFGSVFFAWEYIEHATVGPMIDSDIGFPYAWSLDRNLEDMWSFELGLNYQVGDFTFSIAPLYTNGYENYSKQVSVEGYDLNLGVFYRPSSGPLKGLTVLLAGDRGFEDRPGSRYGDRLHYWDIKFTAQYDLNFLQ